jgi:sugar O-acyltransferase (sialic acid O-acetyltransferase NeuD family)
VLWGATGQARVLRECLSHLDLEIVALFDNDESIPSPFSGVPLYHKKEGFEKWVRADSAPESTGFLVAIGGDRGRDRVELQEYLQSFGLQPFRAIHPRAFVADTATVGEGSQILANVSICVDVSISRGCIINTGAIVDHDCFIGEGVHIAPGAHLAGCVHVEKFATVGTGAVVLPRKRIGEGATVGAGAVVVQDVPPGATVVGNPARIIKRG